MQLSKKQKTFPASFVPFLKSTSNFEHSEIKDDPLSSSIVYEGIGGVSILLLLLFFYEKFLHTKKIIKSKQATFTQIFHAHKKHKKRR